MIIPCLTVAPQLNAYISSCGQEKYHCIADTNSITCARTYVNEERMKYVAFIVYLMHCSVYIRTVCRTVELCDLKCKVLSAKR